MSKKRNTQQSGNPANRNNPSGSKPAAKSSAPLPPARKAQRAAAVQAASRAPITSTGARAALERRSRPVLLKLSLLPPFVVPILLGLALLAGLALPWNWAGIILILVAAFLGWLTALSWPVNTVTARVLRVVVVGVLFGFGVMRMLGRL